ncbi:DNA sulfur modification protein DndB [Cellulosimicrobium cellulans]|uniref:DNA sulfur modification protein DndB n=1 Tax=Cellulosimicrobium cellulans TaxID=1710 RepID=UPI000849423B|nr:DNA sulfur modification protein DndB [Cellulosimicrobium cellulans]
MSLALPSGYDPYERFFASRYRQGGRVVYGIDFSVRELITFLPKPDPNKPLDSHATQRRIVPAHARDFANYILETPEWVSPALLVRAPDIFKFEPYDAINTATTQFGILAVPKDARDELSLVDGQHRTLGFHIAWEILSKQIEEARADLAAAKNSSGPEVVAHFQKVLDGLLARRDELSSERVSVQVVIVETPEVARRIFVDINDNAKGITGAVRERFNDRTAVGRALNSVLDRSDLLDQRVDLEQDRILGSSPYLLGAKHVADIIRALAVGNGRIGKNVAKTLQDSVLVKQYEDFEDALLSAFPVLTDVQDGNLSPAELRQQHLIGSNVVLRAFAAAWHDLTDDGLSAKEIADAWSTFDEYMSLPVYANSKDSWFALGVIEPRAGGSYAARSRAQDFKVLTNFIVKQTYTDGVEWHRSKSEDSSLIPKK